MQILVRLSLFTVSSSTVLTVWTIWPWPNFSKVVDLIN